MRISDWSSDVCSSDLLFAQFGFAGTSLRQVTTRADVNIAAVNYHFGSKENLVNEVFRRRLDELSQKRLEALDKAQTQAAPDLESVLAAFIEPALALTLDRHGGGRSEEHTSELQSLMRISYAVF